MCICDAPSTSFKLSKNRFLENATALQRMTVDPVSRMVHINAVDVMVRYREVRGRLNAKSYLARQKFSQILTIL
uniref:Uncharacterized protein n=1 Tax=Arundo donax TaxID=35708 RepID=A0A0A9B7B5_ARUDO